MITHNTPLRQPTWKQNRTEHILLRNLYKHVSRYKHNFMEKIKLNLQKQTVTIVCSSSVNVFLINKLCFHLNLKF